MQDGLVRGHDLELLPTRHPPFLRTGDYRGGVRGLAREVEQLVLVFSKVPGQQSQERGEEEQEEEDILDDGE